MTLEKESSIFNWVKKFTLTTNVNKLSDVFNTQGITFEESDEVYVLTKKVLATYVAETFFSMREAGNAKYCDRKTYSAVNQYGIQ